MKTLFLLTLVSLPLMAANIQLGIAPFEVKGGLTKDKLESQIEGTFKQAKKKKIQVLLLPELITFSLLSLEPKNEQVAMELEAVASYQKRYEKFLKKMSLKYQIVLIGASTIVKESDELRNRAYITGMNGELSFQDKIYPTPWEVKYNFKGKNKIHTFEILGAKAVILICHDSEFPDISNELKKFKPEIIFVPSMTDDILGFNRVSITSQARAIEHMSYVATVGTFNRDKKAPWHSYYGNAALYTPQNKYFKWKAQITNPNKDEILPVRIDLDLLRKARADNSQVYPARDIITQNYKANF